MLGNSDGAKLLIVQCFQLLPCIEPSRRVDIRHQIRDQPSTIAVRENRPEFVSTALFPFDRNQTTSQDTAVNRNERNNKKHDNIPCDDHIMRQQTSKYAFADNTYYGRPTRRSLWNDSYRHDETSGDAIGNVGDKEDGDIRYKTMYPERLPSNASKRREYDDRPVVVHGHLSHNMDSTTSRDPLIHNSPTLPRIANDDKMYNIAETGTRNGTYPEDISRSTTDLEIKKSFPSISDVPLGANRSQSCSLYPSVDRPFVPSEEIFHLYQTRDAWGRLQAQWRSDQLTIKHPTINDRSFSHRRFNFDEADPIRRFPDDLYTTAGDEDRIEEVFEEIKSNSKPSGSSSVTKDSYENTSSANNISLPHVGPEITSSDKADDTIITESYTEENVLPLRKPVTESEKWENPSTSCDIRRYHPVSETNHKLYGPSPIENCSEENDKCRLTPEQRVSDQRTDHGNDAEFRTTMEPQSNIIYIDQNALESPTLDESEVFAQQYDEENVELTDDMLQTCNPPREGYNFSEMDPKLKGKNNELGRMKEEWKNSDANANTTAVEFTNVEKSSDSEINISHRVQPKKSALHETTHRSRSSTKSVRFPDEAHLTEVKQISPTRSQALLIVKDHRLFFTDMNAYE
ncbi:hypothetical protein AB6A40_003435 [Gnathostoma spinigerum]|uniref:Uncharacterized protein n=1 Tax=Gnathostoma spinigerum TaxID=75299 RepID=A0ABD6EC06_9BILA